MLNLSQITKQLSIRGGCGGGRWRIDPRFLLSFRGWKLPMFSTPDFCFLSEVENFPCSLTYNGLFSQPLQRLGTPKVCLFFRARYFCLRWLFLLTPIAAVYRIHKSIFFAFFYFVKFKSQHINKIFTLKPLTVFREVHNGNVPQTKKREN